MLTNNLEVSHLQEWLNSSVSEDLIRLNVESLKGDESISNLVYALPQTARRNDGCLRQKYFKKYAHTQIGGWWVSGLDPYNDWQDMEWGRFKPDQPRQEWDAKKQQHTEKFVKYESPAKTPNRVTYLRVPLQVWEKIAQRYCVPMPKHVAITEFGEALGFWAWVVEYPEIPIILTEGEKKAGCLLSLGFVALALPGIWGGRVGEKEVEKLHPDLIPVATKGRNFIILFDYETKPKTKRDIFRATKRTGQTIINQGCHCDVVLLPGSEKGIDDWVVALGKRKAKAAVELLISDRLSLKGYQQYFLVEQRSRGLKKYKPSIVVNSRYLSSAVELPESGFVGLDSYMGSGKTELLSKYRKSNSDKRFLNNGHRVNLLKNLAKRLDTQMYSALRNGNLGQVDVLSITVDSLYKMANNLQEYDCLFIDEACQYLVHLLHSKTCRRNRAEILEVLEYVVFNSKLVVLADAHLDDLTVGFFLNLRPTGEEPIIVQNKWKPPGRKVYWYEGNDSSDLIAQLHRKILEEKKIFLVSDSKRFIKKIERTLSEISLQAQNQLKIWTIHGDNSGSPENVLFIENINHDIKAIDVLLGSPSIGTGIDISTEHFDEIFGVFHGVHTSEECVQQLWRYRPNVPMHLWAAGRPLQGYAQTNWRRIKEEILQKNELTAFLIRIDRETGRRGAEKDWALDSSCKIQAQRNFSINNLRADLRSLLSKMGSKIIPMGDGRNNAAKDLMKTVSQKIDEEYCQKVTQANCIDGRTYDIRQRKEYLKPEDIFECEKYRIKQAYGMSVTPELVKKDDCGKLIKKIIQLEAILADPQTEVNEQGEESKFPPELVAQRDRTEREKMTFCTDWHNCSASWLMRSRLGLRQILLHMFSGGKLTGSEDMVLLLGDFSKQFATHIKAILNLTIPDNKSAMWVLGSLLHQLGLSTDFDRLGSRDRRVKHYFLNADDLTFAKQVLEYRQKRREQRELKQQEEKKRAQDHAARMQAMYGIEVLSDVSAPPNNINENNLLEGQDTNRDELPFMQKIKAFAQLVKEAFVFGAETVQELIKSLDVSEIKSILFELEKNSYLDFCKLKYILNT